MCQAMRRNLNGGVNICNKERTSDKEEVGAFDEDIDDKEDLGTDDEVTDAVGIGEGSKYKRSVEKESERSGMGRDNFLDIWREIVSVIILLDWILFSN